MTQELVTTQTTLAYLQDQVEQKIQMSPSTWIDASLKLAVLVGDENDKLFYLQQKVAQLRVDYMEKGENVSKAKALVEATDEYREAHIQKAKIDQIFEFIRIAKLRSRITMEELKGG